ncbi:hypothetical protein D1871_21840 [Nakamurella silvestris]|nr:hypothetical protein D1871_21840 [Nakamurella silvestris]
MLALALSACGSDPEASPSPEETTSASASGTPTVTAVPDSSSAPTDPGSAGTSGEPTSTVEAAELGADSVAWMSAFCTGYAGLGESGNQLTAAAEETDPSIALPAFAQAYDGLGNGLTTLGETLSGLEPPSFTDGKKVATTFVDAFAEYGPRLIAKGAELKAVDLADTAAADAALKSAMDANTEFNQGINGELGALGSLTPAEQAAIIKIPACTVMGG